MARFNTDPYFALWHIKQGNGLPKKMRDYCIKNGWLTEDGITVTEKGEDYLTHCERQAFLFPPKK